MAVAMVSMSASAATKIYVCGTKITGSTSFSAGGGTVSFDNSSRILTISNVSYTKTGSSNNGISVDEVSGTLTINMTGTVSFDIGNADAVLCKSGKATYINISGTATFLTRSSGHAALKLQDGDVTVQGSGTLNLKHTGSSDAHAVKGGTKYENLTLAIKNCNLESPQERLYNLKKVTINPSGSFGSDDYSTKVTFKAAGGTLHASSIGSFVSGEAVRLVEPINFYGYTPSMLTHTTIAYSDALISDVNVVALIDSSRFPDANFRGYLQRSLFPKGYITTNDVNATTAMNVGSEYISDLTGLGYFSKLVSFGCEENNLTSLPALPSTLKYLYCGDNKLTSLPSLPSGLLVLDCYKNQLTSLPSLPSSLQTLECEKNKFSTLSVTGRSALKTLKISDNPYLTNLNCYNNGLTTLDVSGCSTLTSLDCHGNQLTALGTLPSSLKTINCSSNQLTSLSSLPTSLQNLDCSSNKFSGTFTLTDRSALKTLNISNNPSLGALNCYSNGLTSLNVAGCTGLSLLYCHNNHQLTSLNVSTLTNLTNLTCAMCPISTLNVNGMTKLKQIYASHCFLTSLNVQGCSALQTLDCSANSLSSLSLQGCTSLTKLVCCDNQIKSSATDALISSLRTLPAGSQGELDYIDADPIMNEGNVITTAQVKAARNKRWIPKKFDGDNWVDIPVSVSGDVNGDGVVTAADITALYDVLLNNDYSQVVNGDQTGDGIITAADVTAVYTILLSSKE